VSAGRVERQYVVGSLSPMGHSLKVCLLSAHPMVLDEFRRLLESSGYQICAKQLNSMLAPDLLSLEVPRASVYVIDAHAAHQATGALLGNILERHENARVLVVGEKLTEADTHSMLRQGVKGILNYEEAREQLPRALPRVAAGGFWVPRTVLSRFVDTILSSTQGTQAQFPHGAQPARAGSTRRTARKPTQ
jgi:DNA-binding NarL/FixJ family response regulator